VVYTGYRTGYIGDPIFFQNFLVNGGIQTIFNPPVITPGLPGLPGLPNVPTTPTLGNIAQVLDVEDNDDLFTTTDWLALEDMLNIDGSLGVLTKIMDVKCSATDNKEDSKSCSVVDFGTATSTGSESLPAAKLTTIKTLPSLTMNSRN
jgi:hypothetical protein